MKVRNENYTNINLEEIFFKINKVIALINKVNTLIASTFATCNFIFSFCYVYILLGFCYFCYIIAQSKFRCYNKGYLSY